MYYLMLVKQDGVLKYWNDGSKGSTILSDQPSVTKWLDHMVSQSIRRSSVLEIFHRHAFDGSMVRLKFTKSGALSVESVSKNQILVSEEDFKNSFSDSDGDPEHGHLRAVLRSPSTGNPAPAYDPSDQKLDSD